MAQVIPIFLKGGNIVVSQIIDQSCTDTGSGLLPQGYQSGIDLIVYLGNSIKTGGKDLVTDRFTKAIASINE
jgi:hypothetical protein